MRTEAVVLKSWDSIAETLCRKSITELLIVLKDTENVLN